MALVPPTFSLFSRIRTEAPPFRAASAAESAAAPDPMTITAGVVVETDWDGAGALESGMALETKREPNARELHFLRGHPASFDSRPFGSWLRMKGRSSCRNQTTSS